MSTHNCQVMKTSMIHIVLIAVFLISFSKAYDLKGFDDTVLFKINWPGTLNEVFLDQRNEILQVTSANNEKYQCQIPSLTAKYSTGLDDYNGLTPLELLSPLFSQKVCSYRLESYWTYELCHGRFIRQYHEEREGKKVKIQEYFLGKWNSDKQKLLEDAMTKAEENGDKLKYKKIEGLNLPYVEIEMDDGTVCDLNNKPRMTKVQYVCFSHGKHEVYSFKETSTCEYEVIILSPFLCAHPKYKPQDSGENIINCMPQNNAPKKPRSMLAMEAESMKLRHLKLSVNKLGKDVVAVFKVEQIGEDGESRLKVELHPLEVDSPLKKTPGESKYILSSDPPPALDDTTPVRAFLDGENCLNGGTGWWKYEFCYGKSVVQYHIDRSGARQSLLLGRFNEADHQAWIIQNPHKRPKPKGQQRTQISHFYSQGSVCDETGKPRQTEVKLKCLENSSSPGQVSLYLLEPKTCQYILGVESPLICDILHLADDDGLINIPTPLLDNKSDANDAAFAEDKAKSKLADEVAQPKKKDDSSNENNLGGNL